MGNSTRRIRLEKLKKRSKKYKRKKNIKKKDI